MASKLTLTNLQTHKTPTFQTQFLHSNHVLSSSLSVTQRKLVGSKLERRKLYVCRSSLKQETVENQNTSFASSNKLVLVTGGTGGVGQLVVASLLNRDVKLRLLLRDPQKATTLFGEQDNEKLQVIKGDTRNSQDLDPSMFEGVTHVICCTGTTAFPSKRWDGDNTPERVDWEGVRNLVSILPRSLSRLILVSSVGVTKSNELPWRFVYGYQLFVPFRIHYLCLMFPNLRLLKLRWCLDMRFESDYVILSNQNQIISSSEARCRR